MGGNDGVHMWDISSDQVNIDNTSGAIFGLNEGVHLAQIYGEDGSNSAIFIHNPKGLIEGFDGDGIHVWRAANEDGANTNSAVAIVNGNLGDHGEDLGQGGLIVGGESAISLKDVESAFIGNASGGAIIGDGSWRQPVIDLQTSTEDGAGADIVNYGLIASSNIPTFSVGAEPTQAPGLPGVTLTLTKIGQDISDLNFYAESAGQSGSVKNLNAYALAASDVVVKSKWGGATYIENDAGGILVGRVHLVGATDAGEGTNGNTIVNLGTWLTTNGGEDGQYGNSAHGSPGDAIQNAA